MTEFHDFLTLDYLRTFAGMVAAVNLIVQFSKGWVKAVFGDLAVRPYAWFWAFALLTFVAYADGRFAGGPGQWVAILGMSAVNAFPVALGAIATYHVIRHCNGRFPD
ncbi:MAG: hypothetical protein QME76_09740 [Bacillota bacterium]|nr:hypothetical protein [Bacillota bacterium]